MMRKLLLAATFALLFSVNPAIAQDTKTETTAKEAVATPKKAEKAKAVDAKTANAKATEAEDTNTAKYVPGKPVEGVSYAKPWQLNFGPAATPVKEKLHNLHNFLLVIITVVTIFVVVLLAYTCIRFRAKRNPNPSKTTHNVLIEIIWTVVPVIILIAILIPSWRVITYMDRAHNPEITLKVIGYQWYWGFEYMDGPGQGIKFESYLKKQADIKPENNDGPYLLETDRRVVLPANTDIRILTTSADVIHSFAMPAFGIKIDAVPGRLNETWINVSKPGVYYGQCSELCGSAHAFMPTAIEVVDRETYLAWVKENNGEVAPALKEDATVEEKQAEKMKVLGTNTLTYDEAEKAKKNK
jgi:cytochrome c oxidase subunit 2